MVRITKYNRRVARAGSSIAREHDDARKDTLTERTGHKIKFKLKAVTKKRALFRKIIILKEYNTIKK